MSKKVVSLAAIWLLLSTLVQATGQPPVSPTSGAAPAASKWNVELVGRWPLPAGRPHEVHDLFVYEAHAYVGDRFQDASTGQLSVVDVSDPAIPTWTRYVDAYYGETVYVVHVDKSHVYTVENDAQDPSLPTIRVYEKPDLVETCSGVMYGDRAARMWIGLWGYLFAVVTSHIPTSNRLLVYGSSELFDKCNLVTSYIVGSTISRAAYMGTYVYLGMEDGRLIIVDISKPQQPTEKSRKVLFPGGIDAMAAAPGIVYLAQGQTIKVIDVSDSVLPLEIESFNSVLPVTQMAADGNYLYVASGQGVEVYDVQYPSSPEIAGYYSEDAEGRFGTALFVKDDLIYTGGSKGMSILRFKARPLLPTLLYDTTGTDVQINGETAPVACHEQLPGPGGGELSSLAACELKATDRIAFTSPGAKVNMYARCTSAASPSLVGSARVAGESEVASVQMERIQAEAICNRLEPNAARETASPVRGTASPEMIIGHDSGALRYSFVPADLPVEVKTGTATVQSTGANEFGVGRDPASGATTVSSYKGSVGVDPTNATLAPVTLQGGQQVEVTAENVGPVTEFREPVYLPLVVRNTGGSPAGGWTTLLREGFEGAFPGAWSVADGGAGLGEHHWGSRTCRPQAGGRSAWAVGGGADGASLTCGSNYPGNVESWMAAGPFDLSDATAAEVTFQRWLNAASGDRLIWNASADGVTFQGWEDSGSAGGWQETVFDLANVPGLGDLTGDPDIWIAFVYSSDASGSQPEGAYVDDIHLRKYVPVAGGTRSAQPPGVRQAGPQEAEGMSPATWVLPGVGVNP